MCDLGQQFLSIVQLGILQFQDCHWKEEALLKYKKRRLLNTMVSTKDHYPHPYGCCTKRGLGYSFEHFSWVMVWKSCKENTKKKKEKKFHLHQIYLFLVPHPKRALCQILTTHQNKQLAHWGDSWAQLSLKPPPYTQNFAQLSQEIPFSPNQLATKEKQKKVVT